MSTAGVSDVSVVAAADAEREALTVADGDVAGVAGTGDIVVVEGAVSISSVSTVGSSCVVCGSLVGSSIDSRSFRRSKFMKCLSSHLLKLSPVNFLHAKSLGILLAFVLSKVVTGSFKSLSVTEVCYHIRNRKLGLY